MKICSISIRDDINEDSLNTLMKRISPRRISKIQKYKFWDDKKRTVYGELLLRFILSRDIGLKQKDIILDIDQNGKPYLRGENGIHFNISHSGDYVVCAIDRTPIGVDIEEIKKADLIVTKRIFSTSEQKRIISDDKSRDELFFQYWTLKESYSKYTGKGLRLPFSSISFTVNKDIYMESDYKDTVYFSSLKYKDKYWISVCTKEKNELEHVEQINIKDIL